MMGTENGKRVNGIRFDEMGRAQVVVWSPEAHRMELCSGDKSLLLEKDEMGYWTGSTKELKPGDLYRFRINGEKELPDPASLSQSKGVHGPSRALELRHFQWTDHQWNNLLLRDYILYEIHTGTFTPEGSFSGIEKKLDHLIDLGITAIELMPVAQFPGNRNWGYDGVYPYAVQDSYGGAEGLQHLVNACHNRGIAVVLDVVYNHLGPEGNYLVSYGPFVTEKYKTPWGGAINFDDAWCDGVRQYFIQNALMWFRDFHIDALRLDAVHAIKDLSPKHILREIRESMDALMKETGRLHHLIVELDLNDNRFINPVEECGYGMNAQWIDEFHHALRVTSGGERTGYYSDFRGIQDLAKAYRDAYVYDGQFSPHRKKRFGVKTDNPGDQFIVFAQNHDQVGNRMLGERLSVLTGLEMQKLVAAAVMVSPFLPMLFMGEEWGEPHPFLYFVSHTDPALAEAVRKGRREEFAAFHAGGEAPDPVSEETFLRSKLQWQLSEENPHNILLRYYKTLISLRKTQPAWKTNERKQLHVESIPENNVLALHRWANGQQLLCIMNFSKKQQSFMPPSTVHNWRKMLDSAESQWMGPGEAPDRISGGSPGSTSLALQPESIVIYADKLYPPFQDQSE